MVSAMSEYATDSVVLKGKDIAIKVSGKLAGSYYPGDVVYQTATGTWTTTTGKVTDTNRAIGVIEFKFRTSSTFGEVDIDTAYTDGTAINLEVVIGPWGPAMTVAAKCKNLSAARYYGWPLFASSSGAFDNSKDQTSAVTVAIVTNDGYTSGDTIVKVHLAHGGNET